MRMAEGAGLPYRRNMPESDPVNDEIHGILSQPLPAIVKEFATVHLYQYRDDALAAARAPGNTAKREQAVAELRVNLRDKLRRLLAWARRSGRMAF
jgi:hypothetical protein